MDAFRPDAEELHVKHVRQPRERVPVTDIRPERRRDARGFQARLHVGVPGHVQPVVNIDETEPEHRREHEEREQRQRGADKHVAAPGLQVGLVAGWVRLLRERGHIALAPNRARRPNPSPLRSSGRAWQW